MANSVRLSKDLQPSMDDFQASIETTLTSFRDSMNLYSQSMQKTLNTFKEFATHDSLVNIHQISKDDAVKQVRNDELACFFIKFNLHYFMIISDNFA